MDITKYFKKLSMEKKEELCNPVVKQLDQGRIGEEGAMALLASMKQEEEKKLPN